MKLAVLRDEVLTQLLTTMKKRKEFKHIDKKFCEDDLKKCLLAHPQILSQLHKDSSFQDKDFQAITNCTLQELHDVYGLYTNKELFEINNILQKLKTKLQTTTLLKTKQLHKKLLSLNASTKDRLLHYPELYKKIFSITGKPHKIVDLACGLNPVSIPFMNLKNLVYDARDINQDSVNILNKYFKTAKLKGKARKINLQKAKLNNISGDICFLFEFIDLVDTHLDMKLLSQIKTNWLVISFPRTIKRTDARYKRKIWFEKILKAKKLKSKNFILGKEKFYIIRNKGAISHS